jgi:hypothetical protein
MRKPRTKSAAVVILCGRVTLNVETFESALSFWKNVILSPLAAFYV